MRHVPLLALLIVGLLTGTHTLAAQTLDDGLRYSESFTLGTARSLGTANSMSAIGADFTAMQSNPAGLAAYRRNEFTLTVAPIISGTGSATLDGTAAGGSSANTRLALPQLGLVLTVEPIGSRWTQVNFAVGVSQTNRFEERIAFEAESSGSITDWFLETANNYVLDGNENRTRTPPENFFAVDPLGIDELNKYDNGPAYTAGALVAVDSDQPSFPLEYESDYDQSRFTDTDPGAPLLKRGDIQRRGYASSIDVSVAGNYDEKLLVGGTLGFARSSYDETNVYTERDVADEVPAFDALTYRQNTVQSGTGIYGRFGLIYRASQALRVGLAYHSPTLWSLDDSYSTTIEYSYTEGVEQSTGSSSSEDAFLSEFRIATPSQYRASVGAIIGRRGFVSAEVGYLDYGGLRYSKITNDEGGSFAADLNDYVRDNFTSAVQLRAGGEVNLDPFQLRLGAEYLGAPVADEDAALGFAAGLGWRRGRFFADLGYKLSLRPDRVYRPYTVQVFDFPQPEVTYTPRLSAVALTVGVKMGR